MNPAAFLRLVFLTSLVSASTLVIASDPYTSSLSLVKTTRLGDNLPVLALQVAQSTMTYKIIEKSVGAEEALLIVQDEINQARPNYQDPWDKNLAACYAQTLSAEELESLAMNPGSSVYVPVLMASQGEVAQCMQAKSTDLLAALLSEALGKAFSRIVPK